MFKITLLMQNFTGYKQSASHCLLFVIVLITTFGASAQTSSPKSLPISTILNSDGSVKPNMTGSFDPSGYKFGYGPRGEPRFMAEDKQVLGSCNDGWDSNFILNGTDSSANAVVSDGLGNIYVGGSFRVINNIVANGIAKWDGTSWSALGSGVNGSVKAIAVTGSNIYVAGNFTTAGGVSADNVAKWDGSSWSALGAGINAGNFSGVNAIAASGNDVYVGGNISAFNHIAHWNGTTWNSLGNGVNGTVHALAIGGNTLYVGGFFSAEGVPANGIAKWDGTSWSGLASGINSIVRAIAISGTNVYVGGGFITAGGISANSIAKWDGSSWYALGSGVSGGTGGTGSDIYSLAVSGTDVYAGGFFTNAGGVTVKRIAKWNGSEWSQMGTGMDGNIPIYVAVYGLAVSGNTVFAVGEFSNAGGVYAKKIAKWSAGTWSSFQGSTVDSIVRSVAVSGNDVYVGGNFTFAGSTTVNNIAKWDGNNWSALGTGIPGGFINVVAVSGNNVYVGGSFSNAGGNAANNIAKWNGTSWSQLGSGVNGGSVFAITVVGSDVYAGGSFTTAGSNTANHIAKWNGTTWTGLNSAIVNIVTTIVPSGDILYVGANTTTVDSPNYFLKYDGTTWTPLGNGMTGGGVSSIAVLGTDVYVAGGFNSVGGVSAARIAKYDGSNWSALGAGLPGNSNTIKIATIGSDLYAVGDFTVANGGPGDRVAKWNGSSWIPLGSGLEGYLDSSGLAVAAAGDSIYVGGNFLTAGCNLSPYFARWRESLWTGSVNTDWHTAANWGNNSVPSANIGVTIHENNASITSADVTVSSLIVSGGRTLTIAAGRTLTVTGNLYLADGNLAGPGTLIVNGDLTLNNADVANLGSITINGTLSLNGGNITGTGSVVVSLCRGSAIAGGSSNSFILAPLTRCVNSNGTYKFPVGTGQTYSPVELANVVGSSNFTVNPKSGAYSGSANGLPANRLLRWWELTNGGIMRADLSLDYSDNEVVGSERRYRAYNIIGGTATKMPTALNQVTNRATIQGVSTFSAWTLAESEPIITTLTGRVTTNRGRGAGTVFVTLTDDQGMIRYGITNPFGYYKFTNVLTFQVYTVQVTSKKYTFPTYEREVDFDELTGNVNFVSSDH